MTDESLSSGQSIPAEATSLGEPVNDLLTVWVGLAAVLTTVVASLGLWLVAEPAGWIAGIAGGALLAVGVFSGARGAVGMGVGVLAVASLLATSDQTTSMKMAVSAAMAIAILVVLLLADFAFALRRGTVVSAMTVQGMIGVHVIAAALGLGLAVLVVSSVRSVSWPGWLLLLPAVVLGLALAFVARQTSRYSKSLQPARPQVVRRMPPPPHAHHRAQAGLGLAATPAAHLPPPPTAKPRGPAPPPPDWGYTGQ